MSLVVQQILVLLAFALVLLVLNLKAGSTWLKFLTLCSLVGSLALAGYLTVGWVL